MKLTVGRIVHISVPTQLDGGTRCQAALVVGVRGELALLRVFSLGPHVLSGHGDYELEVPADGTESNDQWHDPRECKENK